MTDYVLMPGVHYQSICDAVREKTGTEEKLCSGDLAERIAGISGGFYDAFWDAFQNGGNATNYQNAFRSKWWDDGIFQPKYPFICRGTYGAYNMFNGATGIASTKLPIEVYDGELNGTFGGCTNLATVVLLKLQGVTGTTGAFSGCKSLKNLTIDGSIDVNFSLAAAEMLTEESVGSVLEHLKDLTGLPTQTLTLHNAVGSRLTDAQKAAITAKNWTLAY